MLIKRVINEVLALIYSESGTIGRKLHGYRHYDSSTEVNKQGLKTRYLGGSPLSADVVKIDKKITFQLLPSLEDDIMDITRKHVVL